MGFERATIEFLLRANGNGISMAHVLTIGRQGMHIQADQLGEQLARHGKHLNRNEIGRLLTEERGFCEPFLRLLGAAKVDSLDFSPYEGATILQDMNQPLLKEHHLRYSLVIDGGSIEHVFHYPQALKNCMEATAVGGHFVTITPTNNLMGHGFYQISPELLFRALSEVNGFEVTHMILFEHPWESIWYEVIDPEQARSRVELINTRPAYLIACAKKTMEKPIFAAVPQQSDYSTIWQETAGKTVGVAHTASQPKKSWRRFLPPGAIRWYRLFQPFRPRLYKKAG
jgi:hypothetical protein